VQTEASDESDVEEEEDDEDAPKAPNTGDRNSQLTVGYKGDRSYVVRGNNIGVFNHSKDHSVKYYATISNIATPKGKGFKPKNVRLFYSLSESTDIDQTYVRLCYTTKIPG